MKAKSTQARATRRAPSAGLRLSTSSRAATLVEASSRRGSAVDAISLAVETARRATASGARALLALDPDVLLLGQGLDTDAARVLRIPDTWNFKPKYPEPRPVKLLVEGFDRPPPIMLGHARPYYGPRVEEQGYAKEQDLLAYLSRVDVPPPAHLEALADRFAGRIRVRPMRRDRFDEDLGRATLLAVTYAVAVAHAELMLLGRLPARYRWAQRTLVALIAVMAVTLTPVICGGR